MSQRTRYIIWRGFADETVRNLIDKMPRSFVVTENDDFWVVFATEEEIRESFKEYMYEGQIRVPEDSKGGERYGLAGQFLVGVDAPIALAEYAGRRNVPPGLSSFDRLQAETLIDAKAIRDFSATGTNEVNVVVVDGGLDEAYLKSIGYKKTVIGIDGWSGTKTQPHVQESQRHANAVARSILSIAPDVQLVDAPILPERIENTDHYASNVILMAGHLDSMMSANPEASWVIVCAWGLLDRKYDRFLGTYVDDHNHMLSSVFKHLVNVRHADVVFSAGNNGLFWPDFRSGHTDRGPHRSIIGSNGLRSVLTVGAVDATGLWIGESAQGPEPEGIRTVDTTPLKPDICAPTGFRENDDRNAVLSGTSGACAVAAGVVGAIRKRRDHTALSAADLIDKIRCTARREGYTGGTDRATPAEFRFGSGILDCDALAKAL